MDNFKKKHGYEYSASLYVEKDLVFLTGGVEAHNLIAVLYNIFPDEIVRQVAVKSLETFGHGSPDEVMHIYVYNGVVVKPYPDLSDVFWLKQGPKDTHGRDGWGPYNNSTVEFRIFERQPE